MSLKFGLHISYCVHQLGLKSLLISSSGSGGSSLASTDIVFNSSLLQIYLQTNILVYHLLLFDNLKLMVDQLVRSLGLQYQYILSLFASFFLEQMLCPCVGLKAVISSRYSFFFFRYKCPCFSRDQRLRHRFFPLRSGYR